MKRRILAAAILLTVLVFFSVVLAQSGQFDLPWHSVDGGGGNSSGAEFALQAAIGQPDSGAMSGGDYNVVGGFLALPLPTSAEPASVFIPLVMKPA